MVFLVFTRQRMRKSEHQKNENTEKKKEKQEILHNEKAKEENRKVNKMHVIQMIRTIVRCTRVIFS